ncbi:hypothetical protein [Wenjunlia vitaminophila]|uniref:hypothetical protein n=1 Tax=Wenjunlia vitaminophila TaxID=76728 RepID=UPI00039D500D|nr:hypothetical protein [Wenjunlia vitaminophila]
MPRRKSALVPLAALTVVLAATGCGSGSDAGSLPVEDTAPDQPPPVSAAPTGAASSSPLPLPAHRAADGSDVSACGDGRCEVRVGPGTALPVPRRLDVTGLEVSSVSADRVGLTGQNLGNSSYGSCSGLYCHTSSSNGAFRVTLGPRSTVIENSLRVEVVAVEDGAAVLRLSPA